MHVAMHTTRAIINVGLYIAGDVDTVAVGVGVVLAKIGAALGSVSVARTLLKRFEVVAS